MPHYRRVYIEGVHYFFTVVTQGRQPILCTDAGRESLRHAVEATRNERLFKSVAWVLLPDHLHCIWEMPEKDSDYSTRWRLIKARFTMEYLRRVGACSIAPTALEATNATLPPLSPSRIRKKEQPIWQRRFWEHCIRDEEDLANHIQYIHANPVKHGLVSAPSDWPYSTYLKWDSSTPLVAPSFSFDDIALIESG